MRYGPFQFIAVRATLLDAGGTPQTGADKGYYSREVTEATIGTEVEEGDRDTLLRGDGEICQTSKQRNRNLGATLEQSLCGLDAALIHFATGALLYTDGTDRIGYQILASDDDAPDATCWEGWSKAWNNNRQATDGSGNPLYLHWVFPHYEAGLGDVALNQKHNAVPITGTSERNDNLPDSGPYDDFPTAVVTGGGVQRPYAVFTDTLPTGEFGTEGFLDVPVVGS